MSFAVGLKLSWGKTWLILIFDLQDELVNITITTCFIIKEVEPICDNNFEKSLE